MSKAAEKRPKIGVPWRTLAEEQAGKRHKIDPYLRAAEQAGGEPLLISLATPAADLRTLAASLDAFVLPGSPADVDPIWYHAERAAGCSDPDAARERTDFALLDAAFGDRKPLLAICYGIQSLNVYRQGTLVQDIASQVETTIEHDWEGPESGTPEPVHAVALEPGSQLARLAGADEVQVNSSHHQAIARAGRGLRVTARAPDGLVEGVELTDEDHWVVGVQWHPERRPDDPLTRALFAALLAACRAAAHVKS